MPPSPPQGRRQHDWLALDSVSHLGPAALKASPIPTLSLVEDGSQSRNLPQAGERSQAEDRSQIGDDARSSVQDLVASPNQPRWRRPREGTVVELPPAPWCLARGGQSLATVATAHDARHIRWRQTDHGRETDPTWETVPRSRAGDPVAGLNQSCCRRTGSGDGG